MTTSAVQRAHAWLGDGAPPAAADLAALIAALVDASGDERERDRQRAHEHRLADERAEAARLIDGLARVEDVVARLTRATVPAAMLTGAPHELAGATELTRVILSSVHDGVMTAQAVELSDAARGADTLLAALRDAPVRLAHPMVETELLRRRRAVLVDAGDQLHARHEWTPITGWSTFVAAPIVVRSNVIAILHTDRGPDGEPADDVDREILATFAEGLARGYERAGLRRRLRAERAELRDHLAGLDARSAELADAPIRLASRADGRSVPAPPRLTPAATSGNRGASDIAVFDGVLTRRELEVLRLLVGGASNRAIADELVISVGTVKFHVNRILGKLHVSNRAGAVARYYALMRVRRD